MIETKIEKIKNVLNRAKLIIDEYNEKLNEENEYAHINIIKDIEKAKELLYECNEGLFFKELHIALKELKEKEEYKFKYYIEEFSSNHRIFIFSSVSVYKSLNIKEITSGENEFKQKYYEITLIS
jgi:hypothetical protein